MCSRISCGMFSRQSVIVVEERTLVIRLVMQGGILLVGRSRSRLTVADRRGRLAERGKGAGQCRSESIPNHNIRMLSVFDDASIYFDDIFFVATCLYRSPDIYFRPGPLQASPSAAFDIYQTIARDIYCLYLLQFAQMNSSTFGHGLTRFGLVFVGPWTDGKSISWKIDEPVDDSFPLEWQEPLYSRFIDEVFYTVL